MFDSALKNALNRQLNAELYSAYLYLSMAAYLDSMDHKGFAHWMRKQAQEELGHAMKFYGYLVERRARVGLGAIKAPPVAWNSPLAVFGHVLKHERKVTGLITKLVNLARVKNDRSTLDYLNWFVKEQEEEEEIAAEILRKLRQASDPRMIDEELGKRK